MKLLLTAAAILIMLASPVRGTCTDVQTAISSASTVYYPAQILIFAIYRDAYGRSIWAPCYYTLDGSSPKTGTLYTTTISFLGVGTHTIRAGHYGLCTGTWVESTKTITIIRPPVLLTLNAAIGGTATGGGQYPPGTTARLTATPDAGWTFLRWVGDVASTNNPLDIVVNSNMTETPVFGSPVSVSQPANGSIIASTNVSELLLPGTKIQFTPIPNSGFYFSSWGGAASGGTIPYEYLHASANNTISATFLPLAVTNVTLTSGPPTNGAISVFSYRADLPATNKYPLGELMFARAMPNPGYAFSGWTGDASGTENPIAITLDKSKTISANFEPGFSVTVNQTDGGVVNYSSRKTVYPAGAILDLQAVPATGFEFAGWSGAVTGAQKTIQVTVNTNLTLFARFRAPLKQPAWEYQSPSSAVYDPVVDRQGRVYVLDRRGVIALDESGNLQWRTITADGTTMTNANLSVEPSGNLRVLSKSIQAGASINLQRLNTAGDILPGSLNIPSARTGLAVSRDGVVYLGGGRVTSVGAGGIQWEFAGGTALEQNDMFAALSVPALDLDGNLYFAAAHSIAAGSATHIFKRTSANASVFDLPLRAPLVQAGAGGPAVQDFRGASYIIDASPVIGTDHVYLVDYDGSILAKSLNGSTVWRFATPDVFATPSIAADGAIYFGAKNSNRFYALNKDGSIRWIKRPGVGTYTVAAIGSDGAIYVSDAVAVYSLDQNGNRKWEFAATVGSPVLAGNRVYVAGDTLYAFSIDSAGPATSRWPMRNGSAQNNRQALELPPSPEIDVNSVALRSGVLNVRIVVQNGVRVALYSSPDLLTWTRLSDQIATNGSVEFTDGATSTGSRFYRALLE